MLNKSEFTKENLKNITRLILFLLSVLGILSVWSDILHEEGNCTKEKYIPKIIHKIHIKNINILNFAYNSSLNSKFCQEKNVMNFYLNFLGLFCNKFFSLVQFPSSCKISDQSDNIPKTEKKKKIVLVE